MKAAVLILVLSLGLSLTAHADFTIVQKMETKGSTSEITLKLKGDKARMEVTPQMTMIVDGKTGDTVTLMNDQKKFLRISGDKAKAIAEMAAKYGGTTAEKPKLVATGKKMTINGYEADEYSGESASFKGSYWIAPKLPESAAIMKQLQAVIPAGWNDLAKGMMDYRDLPGFPLRSKVKVGEEEITTTVTAIKADILSESEFAAPKDFREMKIPNVKVPNAPEKEPAAGSEPKPAPSTKP